MALLVLQGGCGSGDGDGDGAGGGAGAGGGGVPPDIRELLAPAEGADIAVLMMGNSHTVYANLPRQLQAAIASALPGRRVAVVVAPASLFLDEHLADNTTRALLAASRWSAVVLQAQKYSRSGEVNHSTAEARQWVRLARGQGAVPVLYPEWARRGVDETSRIWALHSGIAAREPACVAPIPQAWDAALAAAPTLPLHADDGNHAAPAGALLTALVLTATLTGVAPETLPNLPGAVVVADTALQARLRAAAAVAVAAEPARRHCPADPLVR